MTGVHPRPLRHRGKLNRRGRALVRRLTAERLRIYGEMLDRRTQYPADVLDPDPFGLRGAR